MNIKIKLFAVSVHFLQRSPREGGIGVSQTSAVFHFKIHIKLLIGEKYVITIEHNPIHEY